MCLLKKKEIIRNKENNKMRLENSRKRKKLNEELRIQNKSKK